MGKIMGREGGVIGQGGGTTVVFPGQGAQRKGMLGPDLAEAFPELLRQADAILGYSLVELCQRDPRRELDRTCFTQPALYVVNALSYLRRMKGGAAEPAPEPAPEPACAIGHSLGEYNALFAAGVFDFATGLRLVRKRGELMDQATGGGMAVVLGMAPDRIKALLAENDLSIDLANLNAPEQTAISGTKAEIERSRPLFESAGARWVPLRVSAAFHSRHMAEASREFGTFLQGFAFSEPRFPVISNVSARPHDPQCFAETLARHLVAPVRWTETVRYVIDTGADRFEEVGPGKTLIGLIGQIRQAPPPPLPPAPSPAPAAPVVSARVSGRSMPRHILAETLGSQAFREAYGLKYAYLAGSMYKGIASEDLVVRLGRAGLMGSFGTGGLKPERIEAAILSIRSRLNRGQAFGMNLLSDHARPDREMVVVDLFLRHGIDVIEASGYMQLTPAVVKYRLAGLVPDGRGAPQALNRVIAKLSRPEVARLFLAPAPENMVDALVKDGAITREQARLSRLVPMADDICVEADSAGHTDRRPVSALFPAVRRLRDEMARAGSFSQPVRVGLAGGIGTPAAAAAAFVMGADFIMTGSINQATVEAGISDAVKDMLVQADVQDTDYAPAGDLFEIGSQIQVLKRGLLFPSRANKLHELYRMYDSLGSIDARTRENIEKNYFRRRFEDVYEETRQYLLTVNPKDIQRADKDEKTKMALVFKWYFVHTMRLALTGSEEQRADYQVHCGPALGSFNRWVQGTSLEQWQNRHVDGIGERLMVGTADVLQDSFWQWCGV